MDLGFSRRTPLRLEAGILYTLAHNLDNGHVFLPYAKLLAAAQRLLGGEADAVEACFQDLLDQGRIVRDAIAGQDACYLDKLYHCETYVAHALLAMGRGSSAPRRLGGPAGADPAGPGPHLRPPPGGGGENRRPAAGDAPHRGAGHRQDHLSPGILALFDHLGLRTAPHRPHRAGGQAPGETCGAEASTIHRLLETRYDSHTGGLTFAHNQREPLDTDAVILDEASMVDVVLMQALLEALPGGCRLVLVGDPHQLPLSGAGKPAVRSAPLPPAAHVAADGDLPPGGGLGHHPGGPGGGRGALPHPHQRPQGGLLLPPPPGPRDGGGHHRGPLPPAAAREYGHPRGPDSGPVPHPEGGRRAPPP